MIVLDTHVLIWLLLGSDRLGGDSRRKIDQAFQDDQLAVSAISFWEVEMLKQKGRIRLDADVGSWRQNLLKEGLVEYALDGKLGIKAVGLQNFHSDPADRFIVSTCLLHAAELFTVDQKILDWRGGLLRWDAAR